MNEIIVSNFYKCACNSHCTMYITNNYSQIKFENQTSKYQIMSKVKKICQNNSKYSIFFNLTKNKFLTQKTIDILKDCKKLHF